MEVCLDDLKQVLAFMRFVKFFYITTSEINKLTKENFDERSSKQAKLATKDDIADFVKERFWWKTSKYNKWSRKNKIYL